MQETGVIDGTEVNRSQDFVRTRPVMATVHLPHSISVSCITIYPISRKLTRCLNLLKATVSAVIVPQQPLILPHILPHDESNNIRLILVS